ncbi:multiple sugar transport system permease protein [Micromonospora phaseoli]|uniref:Multiple sugar transport system permease protein n=1 Tax=Micromonospora phaseoli TaxID=1144548 RepID=A0A1H7DXL6_9ACTN|nr:carbohydrate ABC transporter permease [Micromonospora phaseoli]PZV88976.1 carbohydrate ABC transporter membrane protein 2 (CUT1 family) [Micromonospora phaseoli]GIJ80970.1 sugar ABC transporter permease [Micromonospora phaseoli]SEK06491.1 multiple sugar transport system permease protein [Micromonospora phaseoli]
MRGRTRGPSPLPERAARLWRTLGAAFVILVFVPPLLLLVAGSLTEPGLPPAPTPQLVPDPLSTTGYERALDLGGLLRASLNSVLVAVVAVPLSVLVASLAGFALARLAPRVTAVVVAASLVALMVPATALFVPRFAIFRFLGLTDTLVPLIAPALLGTSPLYVLVYYLAFRALPAELYDACLVEDLSPLRTWWRVGLPLVRPVTAGLTALTFVLTWSNFLDPLIYVYDRNLFTLPLALRSLSLLDPTNFPVFLAGAVIATVPALVVFALAQRRFLHHGD